MKKIAFLIAIVSSIFLTTTISGCKDSGYKHPMMRQRKAIIQIGIFNGASCSFNLFCFLLPLLRKNMIPYQHKI